MHFPTPLIAGQLVRRYKRFLSDIELESGEVVTAHCANPGSMIGLAEPGMKVWLSPSDNPKRKLKYSWELVAPDGTAPENIVGINTSHPNAIVAEAVEKGRIEELSGYTTARREVRYGVNSRIDLLLESDDRPPCYVEVKNVTLKRGQRSGEFPDAVTKRGAKHLVELADVVGSGGRAVMLFLLQRSDCEDLTIAADIDPAYAEAFETALEGGVEALAYSCKISPEAILLDQRVPVVRPSGQS